MIKADQKRLIHITSARRSSQYVREEVEALGYIITSESDNGVFIEGDYRDCIRLNLNLRTAYRVMWHLADIKAAGPDDLYKEAYKLEWDHLIDKRGFFSIQSHVVNDNILDTRFANVKLKDAIVDRFMLRVKMRPDTGPETDKTVIYLYWVENKASIYLDTSGFPLSKHGYRKIPLKAPLLEGLAASIIKATKWDKNSNFINPMCGSGTLAIEAALMAIDKVPGLLKDNFGFMHTRIYQPEVYEELVKEAKARIKPKGDFHIVATDISEEAVSAAQFNAREAGVEDLIEFKVCDFKETPIYENGGVVVINPEYGERLGEEENLVEVYKELGDFFKSQCKGYMGYIFTGNMNLAKRIGLKARRRVEFYNAKIECRLLEYELYGGTRRVFPVTFD